MDGLAERLSLSFNIANIVITLISARSTRNVARCYDPPPDDYVISITHKKQIEILDLNGF